MANQVKFATLRVPVTFTGVVTVLVPTSVPEDRRATLANKLATARILATTDNPDAPEDNACEEYRETFDLTESKAGMEWDACECDSVSGQWLSLQTSEAD
jgi:hypothetical protein